MVKSLLIGLVALLVLATGATAAGSKKDQTRYVDRLCVWVEQGGTPDTAWDLKAVKAYTATRKTCIVGKRGKPGKNGKAGRAVRGAAGAVGPVGATGSQGVAGAVGAKGDTGRHGAQGSRAGSARVTRASRVTRGSRVHHGPAGSHGHSWCSGPPGHRWPRRRGGAKGDTGATGAQGDAGANGTNGPNGAAGPEGADGPTGPMGPAGPKGDTGTDWCYRTAGAWARRVTLACWSRGLQGPAGPAGPAGPEGPPVQQVSDGWSIITVAGEQRRGSRDSSPSTARPNYAAISGGFNIQGSVTASFARTRPGDRRAHVLDDHPVLG